jgi:glycogen debranching enzyme
VPARFQPRRPLEPRDPAGKAARDHRTSVPHLLSPYGVRSLSKQHAAEPYEFSLDGHRSVVAYSPAESTTNQFGGNSNWRGPIWLPLNFLIIASLHRFHRY